MYIEKNKNKIDENKNILKQGDKISLTGEEEYKLPIYGRNVRVYYREEWFGKQLYFYPLWSRQDKSIVEVWNIEQPISLRFNGEKLQVIEEGKIIKEYEARSGKMENRNAESNSINLLNQPDNKTSNDNQTHSNILNSAKSIKPVDCPISSASNTLDVEDSKKFYYDSEAKYKLAEGEYYIFGNKISNFVETRFSKLFTNNTGKVGTKYIQIHKNLLGDSNVFLPELERMLIHGGKDYEDKGGIDLSTGADEFFTDLDKFVNETYKDKLYMVSNKVPIKLIVKYGKSLSIEEARVRAFLRMIRVGEGTKGPEGYETVVGGKLLKDYGKNFSQHPNVVIRLSSTLKSTAAGAYQFLWSTWRDYAIKKGINDFSPINQDRACVILLRDKRYATEYSQIYEIKCNK